MLHRTSLVVLCVAALGTGGASVARADDAPAADPAAAASAVVSQPAAAVTPPIAAAASASLDPAAWALASTRHQQKCVPGDALTVRLVVKQHAVVAKAAFWIDDQRVGTATGSLLYAAHVKTHRVVRPQTFTNLPAGPMTLKVIVRTRGGASYLLRRVYYHCSPPQDAPKTISVR